MRALLLLLMITVLVACAPAPTDSSVTPAVDPAILAWDRRADAILFRADVLGGQSDFDALDDIPPCTIFGDNRVVWVNELSAFHFEVLYDAVSDDAIREFVRYLTVDEGIYTFGWNVDTVLAAAVAPVFQTVTLTVNSVTHQTDSFSGWDAQLYIRVLTRCKELARAPILYQPGGAWVSVVRAPYNQQAPISYWDAGRMGFNLASADGAPARWLSGAALLALWEARRTLPTSLLYTEDYATYYAVALQLPGITRAAPPAP